MAYIAVIMLLTALYWTYKRGIKHGLLMGINRTFLLAEKKPDKFAECLAKLKALDSRKPEANGRIGFHQ